MDKFNSNVINKSSGDFIYSKSFTSKITVARNKHKTAEVNVLICRSAFENILNYARSDTSVELGGVLMGRYQEKEGRYLVVIESEIKALHTGKTKTEITFTHKTWEYINQIKEKEHSERKIVGWFHTHPGFGVFLSSHDKFIQNHFFNLPWQLAYIIDPVLGKHGFFSSRFGRIIKVPFEHYF